VCVCVHLCCCYHNFEEFDGASAQEASPKIRRQLYSSHISMNDRRVQMYTTASIIHV